MPQLDGLRAVAVTFVMVFHFVPWVAAYAPLGATGVRLFFVLSGFLITGILLSWRDRPLGAALKTFYLRRSVRIFPLFYFALAVAAIMDIGPVRDTIGWHVSYLSNIYFYLRGDWAGSVSHLWSLAVEEQFYLVWPWLILCLPELWLGRVIVGAVLVAPLSRVVFPGELDGVLPTSCLDALGLGSLLALARRSATGLPASAIMRAGLWAGAPIVIVTHAMHNTGDTGPFQTIALDFGVSLLSAWVVGRAADGFSGLAGSFLSSRPVTAVGKISYGLYVYHGFIVYGLARYVPVMDMTWPVRFVVLAFATGVAATLSWHLLEKPFLRLKPVAPLAP